MQNSQLCHCPFCTRLLERRGVVLYSYYSLTHSENRTVRVDFFIHKAKAQSFTGQSMFGLISALLFMLSYTHSRNRQRTLIEWLQITTTTLRVENTDTREKSYLYNLPRSIKKCALSSSDKPTEGCSRTGGGRWHRNFIIDFT